MKKSSKPAPSLQGSPDDATPPAASPTSPRFPGLDGLRALAVTLVIVFHLTPGVLPGGYLGVDVFFVISGFLITALLLREHARSGRISLTGFWRRRARRLLPALAIVVLVCSSAALALASMPGGREVLVGLGRQVLGAATFSYNWLALAGGASYFDETTPELFRNLWSLAVEEQFYLVWPVIVIGLALLARKGWRLAIVGGIAVASAAAMITLYALGADATRVYYGTDTHSFGLALGAVLAIVAQGWPAAAGDWPSAARRWLPIGGGVAVVGIIAIAVLMPAEAPVTYLGGLVLVAVLSTAAIAGSLVPGARLGRRLDAAPFRWIGERSYGLYLWHWPAAVLVAGAAPAWHHDPVGAWAVGAIALAVTVPAAALSYRFVEQPVRRLGVRGALLAFTGAPGPGRRFVGRALAATVAAASVIALTTTSIVVAPRTGDVQVAVEAGQAAIDESGPERTAPDDPAADDTVTTPEPVAAALPGGDQIVAIGDSVMLAAAPQLQETFPGIAIDAVVSRQMRQAPEIVREVIAAGGMRPILVIGLGTNGWIERDTLDEIVEMLDGRTQLVLVNVQAPRDWAPTVNEIVNGYAQEFRDVELANWHDAIQPRLDELARDRIHPGGPITGSIYAGALRDALQRLAELPPRLNPNDYGLSPRPA